VIPVEQVSTTSGTAGGAGKDTGNTDSEEESNGEEEEQLVKTWGHARLSRDVYGRNPFVKTRVNQPHTVWDEVKCLKNHTVHGTTVHQKYTHV